MELKKLYKALNKAEPYRIVRIRNEYGVENGQMTLPDEDFMIKWLKNNDLGSSSFNHTELGRRSRGLKIETIWALEEYTKCESCK